MRTRTAKTPVSLGNMLLAAQVASFRLRAAAFRSSTPVPERGVAVLGVVRLAQFPARDSAPHPVIGEPPLSALGVKGAAVGEGAFGEALGDQLVGGGVGVESVG